MNLKYILLFLLISLANLISGEPIELHYADVFHVLNTVDSKFREFSGNVQFSQGNVNVKCDYAKQFIDANIVELTGNVVITQKTLTLKAPKIIYNGDTYIANASGGVNIIDKETNLYADNGDYSTKDLVANFRDNVIIEDDSATIFSNSITHNRINRNSFAFGDVVILGKFTNAIMTGDTLLHYPKLQKTIAFGNPVLFKIDTSKATDDLGNEEIKFDTMSVSCDSMIAFRYFANEHYVFNKRVEMFKEKITAKCDSAVYFKDLEYIKLIKTPLVWYDSTQLYADSILVKLPNKKLSTIEAFSKAITISKLDTNSLDRFNQLSGNEIIIKVSNDSIKSIKSTGEAKSIYYMADENGNNGLDRRTTDKIEFQFNNGDIENIQAIGKTFAEYFPEPFIYDRISSFNLPNFKWTDKKPLKKYFNLNKSSKNNKVNKN